MNAYKRGKNGGTNKVVMDGGCGDEVRGAP